ncbi:MAG TPA: hypothetical protein DCX77_00120 [Acidimicrobiaceae bacterium]|nr:hypothetical protein [Acidimicrobiaceae bacterium]HAX04055.1 hypothetical protein [Acidimicrobiaceae bacterium]|tara:strand:- start:657 stop:1406 length:750 start_codon:yes stop_codon:yes gene_type:complete
MQNAPAWLSSLSDIPQASSPEILAQHRTFPVVDELAGLFTDGGIRQGSTIEVTGAAAVSLASALTIAVSHSGGWVAAVGLPMFGSSAASDLGIKLSRWAFIDHPGDQAGVVIHALTVGVDLILIGPDIRLRSDHGRKIVARMRERGASVITIGKADLCNLRPDLCLRVSQAAWTGIELGHGRLTSRKVEIERLGRGADSNLRRELVWLPDGEGRLKTFGRRNKSVNLPRPSHRVSKPLVGIDELMSQAS